MKVIVYGTLKRGGGLNPHLREGTYIGDFQSKPEFTMVNLGWFPGVLHRGDTIIHGEVFEINEEILHSLDRVEGYPSMYTREELDTPYGKAWIYIYNTNRIFSPKAVVSDGVWRVATSAVM